MSDTPNTEPRDDRRVESFEAKLPVKLNPERRAEFSRQLAATLHEQDMTRVEAKETIAGFKEKIAELGGQINNLGTWVRTGVIEEAVECRRIFDYPTLMVLEERLDTGEEFNRRPMSPNERQKELALIEHGACPRCGAPMEKGNVAAPLAWIKGPEGSKVKLHQACLTEVERENPEPEPIERPDDEDDEPARSGKDAAAGD